jgi:hypothetical protein
MVDERRRLGEEERLPLLLGGRDAEVTHRHRYSRQAAEVRCAQ